MAAVFDVGNARKHFPALGQSQVFMDNAGGTQVLGEVIEAMRSYLMTTNVQLGASYKTSAQSTQQYNAGIAAGAAYINADPSEVVLGSSTTQLFRNLSQALRPHFPPGSEIVVSALDHEANIASWVTMAEDLGLTLIWWRPNTPSMNNPHLSPESLEPLLSEKTRFVSCTHCSNILGTITQVRALADLIHKQCPNALFCVDGVAYAPHRPIDMKALGVDIYCFSWYKVYGPHIAQMYVNRRTQDTAMRSLGHFFKNPADSLEEKLGLAGAPYELVQPIPLVSAYLKAQSWEKMAAHETELQESLLKYLRSKPELFTIRGESDSDGSKRVPVISFTVKGRNSRDVVEAVEKKTDFGFRWGHFYSKRLMEDTLLLPGDDGIVRVSLVHYNTVEEVQSLVKALDAEVGELD